MFEEPTVTVTVITNSILKSLGGEGFESFRRQFVGVGVKRTDGRERALLLTQLHLQVRSSPAESFRLYKSEHMRRRNDRSHEQPEQ